MKRYIINVYDKNNKENSFGVIINVDYNGYLLYNKSVLLLSIRKYKDTLLDMISNIYLYRKLVIDINDIKESIRNYIVSKNILTNFSILDIDIESYYTTVNETVNTNRVIKEYKFTEKERFKLKRIYYANDYKRKNEYKKKLTQRQFSTYKK